MTKPIRKTWKGNRRKERQGPSPRPRRDYRLIPVGTELAFLRRDLWGFYRTILEHVDALDAMVSQGRLDPRVLWQIEALQKNVRHVRQALKPVWSGK